LTRALPGGVFVVYGSAFVGARRERASDGHPAVGARLVLDLFERANQPLRTHPLAQAKTIQRRERGRGLTVA